MEPVYMILGQSAAVAVKMAIEEQKLLHLIDYHKFRAKLASLGQVLDAIE
jgi:hypothetical protein